jgi:hypothetical protein
LRPIFSETVLHRVNSRSYTLQMKISTFVKVIPCK